MNGLVIIFVVFAICLILNVPIAYSLGLSGMIYILVTGNFDMTSFGSIMINGVDSFPLMAIPFFILAGSLMEIGGISKEIVNFASSVVGNIRGGLAMVAIISCAFFAALSGSGIATTAAIGAIMIPEMEKAGYNKCFSAALIAAAGCLGPIIPPSVPMVMFGSSTETSVTGMLMGGVIPGLFLALLLCVFAYFYSRKNNIRGGEPFNFKRFVKAFVSAIPALLVPVIILGGIYSGIFTPTESAAVAVIYAVIAGKFIYKQLSFAKLKESFTASGAQTGNIMIIVACATFFARMLTMEQFQAIIKDFVLGITDSKILVLLILNIVLLILGALMDTTPVILVFAPILTPIAVAYGVNPVHFGVIMCINLAIGLITPPVGLSLYVASGQIKEPVIKVIKASIGPLLVLIAGLLVITYVPGIVTWLPTAAGILK